VGNDRRSERDPKDRKSVEAGASPHAARVRGIGRLCRLPIRLPAWAAAEFVDHGVSGTRERRSGLEALLAEARARRVDVVACVKLDRLARSVHHRVAMAREFEALGVDLVVLDQSIDTTTPAGRLLFHMLAAISEFERDLIRDRVLAGLRRARAQGIRIGRPKKLVDMRRAQALLDGGQSLRQVAKTLGIAASTLSVRKSSPPAAW
jgi:DNA invertase Pin-like site-specific DNA recombinase